MYNQLIFFQSYKGNSEDKGQPFQEMVLGPDWYSLFGWSIVLQNKRSQV